MASKQSGQMVINTPLGPDALQIKSFRGGEQVSRPFEYEVELVGDDSDVDFDKLVGQQATVQLNMAEGARRYFNGYISKFALVRCLGATTCYRATLVPWLWFLTRCADCRIFQEKSAPDIIKEIVQEHGFSGVFDKSSLQTHPTLHYCVQYRETDFSFVSRLMESEGICYYFKHENGKHTLVLSDSKSGHEAFPGYANVPYQPPSLEFRGKETIYEWALEQEVQTGAYALNDFDFNNPRAGVLAAATQSPEQFSYSKYEMFDYPGGYNVKADGEAYSRVRIEELRAQAEVARGECDARGIAAGYLFTLDDFPRADQCREYLVTSASYMIENPEENGSEAAQNKFACTFTAIPSEKPFRPARVTPKPVVKGPQTAIVVGKSGEEIWTDEFGRVRLQFHCDRYGKSDENSSCWVRVAQVWAGKNWGAINTPRLGQEVIVEFLEGDPDQPIVTGRVYNKDHMPPYTLPASMTKSAVKTDTTKGSGGSNEICFEDKKDEEHVLLRGQKDMSIHTKNDMDINPEHDLIVKVGNDTFVAGEHDFQTDVKNDRKERTQNDLHVIVGKGTTGSKHELVSQDNHLHVKQHQVQKVEGNMQLTVEGGKGGDFDLFIKKTKKEEVGEENNLHIKGDSNEKVDGDLSLNVGGKEQKKVGMAYAVDAGQEVHIKGGMKVIIEAGLQLSLKAAGSFVDIGPAGVSIQGVMVKINSGGAAGSGGGSSPKSPKAPKKAEPVDPTAPSE